MLFLHILYYTLSLSFFTRPPFISIHSMDKNLSYSASLRNQMISLHNFFIMNIQSEIKSLKYFKHIDIRLTFFIRKIKIYFGETHRNKNSKIVSSPTIENRSIQQNFFSLFSSSLFFLLFESSRKIENKFWYCLLCASQQNIYSISCNSLSAQLKQ